MRPRSLTAICFAVTTVCVSAADAQDAPPQPRAATQGRALSPEPAPTAPAPLPTAAELEATLERIASERHLEHLPAQIELSGNEVLFSIITGDLEERFVVTLDTFAVWLDTEFHERENTPRLLNWDGQLRRVRRRARRDVLSWETDRAQGAEGLDSPR